MPRISALLVVIALLAAPVALLARGIFCDPTECNCATICPMMQDSHSQPMCGMAKHAPMCGTHQGRHALDYGFIAPFAPTAPLPQAQLAAPLASLEFLEPFAQFSIDGVPAAPFNPPRS